MDIFVRDKTSQTGSGSSNDSNFFARPDVTIDSSEDKFESLAVPGESSNYPLLLIENVPEFGYFTIIINCSE